MHIQDLEIDAAYRLNLVKSKLLLKLALKFEKFIFNRFNQLTTISPMMKKLIINKGIESQKIEILPNWADIDNINPKINSANLKENLSIPDDKKIILYSGNIGEKQNLESIINVAETAQKNGKNYIFLIIGDEAAKNRLVKLANYKKLKNVQFEQLVPKETLGELLTMADIHLVIQNINITDSVLPSKLTNILSAGGVAIISAVQNTQLSQLVREHKLGYLISPNSEEELYAAITYLLKDKKLFKEISNNARNYAVNYLSKEKILTDFQNVL